MRIGQNPAKFIDQVAKPKEITVAVLNYIPFLSGFYAQTMDVLIACMQSIWENTDLPFDLLVFDNGSCPEALEVLLEAHRKGRIQFLLLSEKNLGKGGAWNIIFDAAPGEIIAYSDNDVLFSPGWLSKSLEILNTFPKAGMVTSRPLRTSVEYMTHTIQWARETPEVALEKGQFIPWETFRDFDLSLGQEEEYIKQRFDSTYDTRVTYQGVQAQIGSSHWQFVARKEVLQQFLPFQMDRPMGQVSMLDKRMNDAGYLRLMTHEPLAMNMSNTPEVIPARGRSAKIKPTRTSLRKRILELALIKRVLLGLYNRIFLWYYAEK